MKLYLLKSSLQAKFTTNERAASIVEYTILLAFVAVVAIIGVRFVATNVSNIFTTAGNSLNVSGSSDEIESDDDESDDDESDDD